MGLSPMPLTDAQAKNARPRDKAYKISDGHGLNLFIQPSGAKYWRLSYRFLGKQKTLALGVYPTVSLLDAREACLYAKKALQECVDPAQKKREAKRLSAGSDTFKSVAMDWFDRHMTGKSDRHRQRAMSILNVDVFPSLGNRSITEISAPEILAVLRKIEARGAIEIAHRARSVISQIYRFGIASGQAERDVSADLRGALSKKAKPKHLAAITDEFELGGLLAGIAEYKGSPQVCVALKVTPILFQRPGEIRKMEWAEINWKDEVWEIPAAKMKMDRDHIVPLPRQVLEPLTWLYRITGDGKYVFPSQRSSDRPLSENGVRVALRTMGYANETVTPHGFRATARTLLDEKLGFRVEYIEHQLAHAVRDPTGRAYNRTKFLNERKEMMQDWADYLDCLRKSDRRS